ncbi:lipoprotein-releasing ABC transporter permease subunit [Echinimonas agarilytica]|uniref:Lipoprotein-releasing ABC transporter permease subunit n=1 Tax=Echinimonas agarilytica TaxID=1215918 RepID=A0AA41W7P7_9GAMM|nr:lipoprotein-releasing ABC transporter permease subunit [Echinimonas agarilytica]MCM2679938.1 lipoprotein-releasing ABC transporter permease subunit [Echinimonas agarilytica]
MFRPPTLFIGLRYARARKGSGFVSFINFFSTAGITIGVMALIVVVSVMNGFEGELKKRILGLVPQVVLLQQTPIDALTQSRAIETLQQHPNVLGAVPFIESQALVQSSSQMTGVQMIGIDVATEQGVSPLSRSMVRGELSDLTLHKYQILMSRVLASKLGVSVGDSVRLSVLEGARYTPVGQVPNQRRFVVGGLFDMGSEADYSYVYVSMKDAARMTRKPAGSAEGIRLYLTDAFLADTLVGEFSRSTQWQDWIIHSWQISHGDLFSAVKMEKAMMWLLLLLIIGVAAFNIVSALFLIVANKQSDVAILQTLGLTPQQITQVFMVQGCAQGVLGAIMGTFVGLLAAANLDVVLAAARIQVVATPGYGAYSLPVDIQYTQVAAVAALAVCMSFLATLYPARQAASVMPAEALRYD